MLTSPKSRNETWKPEAFQYPSQLQTHDPCWWPEIPVSIRKGIAYGNLQKERERDIYIEHAWFATIPVGFIWSYLFGAYFQCWAHQNSLFLVFPNIDRPLWIPSRNHTSVSWWFYFFDLRPPIPIPLHNIIIYLRQNQTWQWNIWTSMNIPLRLPSKNAQKTLYIRFPTRSLWLRQNRHPPTAGCPRKCCQLEIGLNRDFYLEINWEPKRKSDVE